MPQSKFRQLEEKNILTEIEMMEWSPKMDLIAVANVQGDVILQRLPWKKVWILPSRGDKLKIKTLSWRPDGKVLAIGYSNTTVLLCDVENAEVLHTLDVHDPVSTTKWISTSEKTQSETNVCFEDASSTFLPKLPSLSKSYGFLSKQPDENTQDSKKVNEQKNLNVLLIGTEAGRIFIYVYGIFSSGDISPTEMFHEVTMAQSMRHFPPESKLENGSVVFTTLNDSLSHMTVAMETNLSEETMDLHSFSFRTPLLGSRHQELHVLALKYGQILSLMSYLSTTIHSISEAWEDILLEIDSKLTNYAEEKFKNSSGTVSDDFLELLMFGNPSYELEKFLMSQLTEKGLKKLGHSIELSYSNIQKLVLKHLQSVGQAIVYHLSEVRGMSLWYEKFGMLGLSVEAVEDALSSAGSFMLKATEIQQVIDNSMRNFKAFFRWLYAIILRLADEPIPPEINKVNQQDLNFVTEFLTENFTDEWEPSKKHIFNLERVGQYLKDEPLQFPPDFSQNPWVRFVNENPDVAKLVYPHYPDKSLVQQHVELKDAINRALTGPSSVMGRTLQLTNVLNLYHGPKFTPTVIQTYSNSNLYTVLTLGPMPCEQIIFLEQEVSQLSSTSQQVRAVRLKFEDCCGNVDTKYKILGVQFYTKEILSLLLVEEAGQSNGPAILAQIMMRWIVDLMEPVEVSLVEQLSLYGALDESRVVNGGCLVEVGNSRRLDKMKPCNFAVSGSRKVVCVLFASRRRVRIFEMDVDEENDETEIQNDETENEQSGLSERRCLSSSLIKNDSL